MNALIDGVGRGEGLGRRGWANLVRHGLVEFGIGENVHMLQIRILCDYASCVIVHPV